MPDMHAPCCRGCYPGSTRGVAWDGKLPIA